MTESYVHADLKYDLYYGLLTDDEYADMEKGIGKTRTDILTEVNGKLLAIEIQYTAIPVKSILRRMKEHASKGAHTLWIIPEATLLDEHRVRNLKWVSFIQQMQEGLLFLPHTDGKQIIPARIDNGIVFKKSKLTTSKKIIDCSDPIDLTDLHFKTTKSGLNYVTFNEWWLAGYLDLD